MSKRGKTQIDEGTRENDHFGLKRIEVPAWAILHHTTSSVFTTNKQRQPDSHRPSQLNPRLLCIWIYGCFLLSLDFSTCE